MKNQLLPSWAALEQTYRARSAKALAGVLLRAASTKQIQELEHELGVPPQLRAWFELHAGTAAPLLFGNSDFPMWRLMSPTDCLAHWREVSSRMSEADEEPADSPEPADGREPGREAAKPSWLPFAISESGSVRWFLAMQMRGPQVGAVLFVDFERLDEPKHEADSLDGLFARELARLASGDIVVVGFEVGPPQIMSRQGFERFSEAEGAFLLPRVRTREPRPTIASDEEGRRFLLLMAESRLIRFGSQLEIAELALAVAKIIRSRAADKAERLVTLLVKAKGIEVGLLRPARVSELLAKW